MNMIYSLKLEYWICIHHVCYTTFWQSYQKVKNNVLASINILCDEFITMKKSQILILLGTES